MAARLVAALGDRGAGCRVSRSKAGSFVEQVGVERAMQLGLLLRDEEKVLERQDDLRVGRLDLSGQMASILFVVAKPPGDLCPFARLCDGFMPTERGDDELEVVQVHRPTVDDGNRDTGMALLSVKLLQLLLVVE